MQHDLQVRILKELLNQLDEGTTHDGGVQCRQPMSSYYDPDLAAKEWHTLFRNHPQIIGLSGDLPEPNSFITVDDFGVPVLATRDAQGQFRAFVNACRHRGAQVTVESRGKRSHFSCPYHAWRYANDGSLKTVPHESHFGDVEKACLGLVELPALEQHGLLWVHPQPTGKIEPESLIGGFLEEFAANDFQQYVFMGDKTIDKRLNWKLANDTFGETYHFKTLHNQTLAKLMHGDNLCYETRGRNHRFVFARKSIDQLRDKPEADWRLTEDATLLYYLFPNIQIILGPGRLTLVKIYPDSNNPSRSISRVHSYFTQPMLDFLEEQRKVQAQNMASSDNVYQVGGAAGALLTPEAIMEVFNSTIEDEDYVMGESQQRTAESGQLQYTIFGKNEAPLQHYHNTFREALGMAPLEKIK